ncbi:BREX-2 system phosphatase PglZ [Streptomyces sp. 8N114]|uniref:BREX-2 system phosphatase PglZ n=1 Tax=Streptomyces sp. 8N114 TaxID=3457419 RepID=UPI003FD2DD16
MTASANTALTRSRPPRLGRAAVEQRVGQLIRRYLDRAGGRRPASRPVILLRAEPVWNGERSLRAQGRSVRVAVGVSPLAVLDLITEHTHATADSGSEEVLVILTDQEETVLGRAVLGLVVRQRVHSVDRWTLVAEQFGAQFPEPRLTEEAWAAEALMSAKAPNGGWPKLSGKILSRDVALRHLAASRMGIAERLGMSADDLDASVLLRWSALPGAPESLASLRTEERQGLVQWLTEITGRAGRALFALIDADHGADALAMGLVCHALWSPDARGLERQKGRVDRFFGDAQLDDATMQAFGDAAREVVLHLLRGSGAGEQDSSEDAYRTRTWRSVLTRADKLLDAFGAREAACFSDVLYSGFEYRADAVAKAQHSCLNEREGGHDTASIRALTRAVSELTAHRLHRIHAHRVERARMAQRLVQWLAIPIPRPESMAAAIDAHISDWSWADHAVAHLQAGDDTHPQLQSGYRKLSERVAERRKTLDRMFAEQLREWTARGTTPSGLVTVENLIKQVVAPVVEGERPVLFVVLEGMSASDAVQIAAEMRHGWDEYDPLGSTTREARSLPARRRGAAAALPTRTRVSRASLFAGTLCEGGQELERDRFSRHPSWQGRTARLFHQDDVNGEAGETLGAELAEALADPQQLVGVVVNTIDDALRSGRERSGPNWHLADLGVLETLLEHAGYHGRAVVITSDHGHVLERNGELRDVSDALSARHREGVDVAQAGEIELAGLRVVAPDRRIVALWDADTRYTARGADYHGGVSAAEVTLPVLAFLPLGAQPPEHWRPLGESAPAWWGITGMGPAESALPQPVDVPAPKTDKKRAPVPPKGQTALALQPVDPLAAFLDELLASEMFEARRRLTPRTVPKTKIRAAMSALLEAGSILPVAVLGERAGEQPARAAGFATILQRIFNVDDYAVLAVTDSGRNVRLDKNLLRQQFELKKDV